MLNHVAISGWGHYVPDKILSNRDLEVLVDTSDEWIRSRTGIVERRVVGPEDSTASMAVTASRRALEVARLGPEDLDLVICGTTTPDHLLPATGCVVQRQLGASRAGAFDLNAACSGFMYGLSVGTQFIRTGTYRRVLVVAAESLTRFCNFKDRNTCVLFGDGAGAVVLEATDEPCGVLSTVLACRGDTEHMLAIEAGGAAKPATAETVAANEHFITMRGNEVFKMAVRSMADVARQALADAGVAIGDLRGVIPHQANLRILRATQHTLGLPEARMYVNVDRYGNTGAASIPIALSEYLTGEPVKPGDNLLLVAFGGGLTWASAVVRVANVDALIARRGATGRPSKRQPRPQSLLAQPLT